MMQKEERGSSKCRAADSCTLCDVSKAAAIITGGGIVAFPTETYYGLAVDPFNELALDRLFRVKQRPAAKPILTLIDTREQLRELTDHVPTEFAPLMDHFWPGPLTLLFHAIPTLSSILTGHTETIGVRLSSHLIARELVRLTGRPITATSANLSGQQPAANHQEVLDQFGAHLDGIIAAGATPGGCCSTIVGFSGAGLALIRDGAIPFCEIEHYAALHQEQNNSV